MFPLLSNFRALCLLAAIACMTLLAYALYVQHGMFMMPCPLCILQRIAFLGMGIAFLLGAIVGPRPGWWRKSVSLVAVLFAGTGAGIATWHLRMQNLPPSEVPSCSGMDLGYMIEAFPFHKVVEKVFAGSGECAVVDWTFLGLAMPAWTLVWYVLLGVLAVWAGWRSSVR